MSKTPVKESNCQNPCNVASAVDGSGEVILPLALKHVTSYLSVYKPTVEEWESHEQPHIELTNEHLLWDPATTHYQE